MLRETCQKKFTPQHTHDCERCRYLYTLHHEGGAVVDIYQDCGTLLDSQIFLLRYGSEPSQFITRHLTEMLAGVIFRVISERG